MKVGTTVKSIAKSAKRVLYRIQMPLTIVAVLGMLGLGFITYNQSRELRRLYTFDQILSEMSYESALYIGSGKSAPIGEIAHEAALEHGPLNQQAFIEKIIDWVT